MGNRLVLKFGFLFFLIILVGLISQGLGLNTQQTISLCIFFASVFATLLFWDCRVAIAFLGLAILLITHTVARFFSDSDLKQQG